MSNTFRPELNFGLAALRAAWPHRDNDDRPDDTSRIVKHITDEGTVQWRVLTWEDFLDLVEQESRGDVT
jgi:hypothetical protein